MRKFCSKSFVFVCCALVMSFASGCRTAEKHVEKADKTANAIIGKYQQEALGKTEPFSIEMPADLLRRRLIESQNLPQLKVLLEDSEDAGAALPDPLVISLVQALEIGARNNPEYQLQKEKVFIAALDLDLAKDAFRNTYSALISSLFSGDSSGDEDERSIKNSFTLGLTRRLQTGATITGKIGIDLLQLLTMDKSSTFGIFGDATVKVPLWRGAGRDIAREPLTQAERDVIYALWDFERYKGVYAVQVADSYYKVLEQQKQIRNAEENYNRIADARKRAQALAEAGRSRETQVDQAYQDELRADTRVVVSTRAYEQSLDALKRELGLPVDARIELEGAELDRVAAETMQLIEQGGSGGGDPGAVESALANRLDLRVVEWELEDLDRKVMLARDAMRTGADLKLGASTRQTSISGGGVDATASEVNFGDGKYSAGLEIELPWELTEKRNSYRKSLIALEQGRRQLEDFQNRVKQSVRGYQRGIDEARSAYGIQRRAVDLAQKRVESTQLFLNAGRSEMRDVLEAQEALVSAQNALMSAVVSYRMAVLKLRLDTGILEVNERGVWYDSEK